MSRGLSLLVPSVQRSDATSVENENYIGRSLPSWITLTEEPESQACYTLCNRMSRGKKGEHGGIPQYSFCQAEQLLVLLSVFAIASVEIGLSKKS